MPFLSELARTKGEQDSSKRIDSTQLYVPLRHISRIHPPWGSRPTLGDPRVLPFPFPPSPPSPLPPFPFRLGQGAGAGGAAGAVGCQPLHLQLAGQQVAAQRQAKEEEARGEPQRLVEAGPDARRTAEARPNSASQVRSVEKGNFNREKTLESGWWTQTKMMGP